MSLRIAIAAELSPLVDRGHNTKCRFTGTVFVGRPKVRGIADGFLNAVIEVVSKAADLRLHFDNGDEIVSGYDRQVPFLGWPEITG
jgi:hypothetical protein